MKALAKLYNEDEASFKKGIEKFIQSVKEEAAKLKGADTEVAKVSRRRPSPKRSLQRVAMMVMPNA